ncbi:MAG: hypothetical protein N3A70_05360 [Anoxybacillus gonensis]|nr:hypothetical protein [Anoxybacillus gonensis]
MFPKLPPIIPFPPRIPTPDPEDVEKVIKIIKIIWDALFNKSNENKDDLSKKKSVDLERAEIHDIAELNVMLNEWAKVVKEKMEEVERQIWKESSYFFEEFYENLEIMIGHSGLVHSLKLSRYKRKLDKIQRSLEGKMFKYVMARISLDDQECRDILRIPASETKRKRMDQFEREVILGAVYELTSEIKEKMADYADELTEIIEEKVSEISSLMSEKEATYLQLEENLGKNEQVIETMKIRSMAMYDIASSALYFLDRG